MKLSILIPTIKRHESYLIGLMAELSNQIRPYDNQIEILIDDAENDIVGDKRNRLLSRANGTYLASIDADDMISKNYIELLMEGINKDVDCCSLVGEITVDGVNPRKFIHSLDYTSWFEEDDCYFRMPNHLNLIRSSIAKQIGFTEKNHGEDYDFSLKLLKSGLLKTEHKIDSTIYFYRYQTKK